MRPTDPAAPTGEHSGDHSGDHSDDREDDQGASYLRFGAMIATSIVVMFGLMYLNTYALDHATWSETRAYMALVMGGAMGIIMLLYMLGMYRNTSVNAAILLGSLVLMAGSLFLVRSQITVDDSSYMSAMIPHHSIAILTSERAEIQDVRVRELANGIIRAQRREIAEMKWLIEDIEENGRVTTQEQAELRPLPEFEGELDP